MNEYRPGLIETLRSDLAGNIPLLARHLRRLQHSAKQLNYPCPLKEIEQSLLATAYTYKGKEGRLRLLLHANGRFELHSQVLPAFCQGISSPYIVLAQPQIYAPYIWQHHKTTHRPDYERARQWLQSRPDYFDCIFVNQLAQICEGSRSTIYLKIDEHWYTPPLACGVLPGIMREILLESGQVSERIITKEAFLNGSAWRISNALYGWQDVRLDTKQLALQ